MRKLLVYSLCFLLIASAGWSATYTMSLDGDGYTLIDGDLVCHADYPSSTAACEAGDIIVLPSGSHDERIVIQDFDGSTDYITITNEDSAGDNAAEFYNTTNNNGPPIWIKDCTYLHLDGSGDPDIISVGVPDSTGKGIVAKLTDRTNYGDAILVSGSCSNVKISYTEMYSTQYSTGYGGGLKVGLATDGNTDVVSDLIVEYTYTHDIGYAGMYIGSDSSTYGEDKPYISDVIVRNNLLVDMGHYGITLKRTHSGSGFNSIYGNIVRPSTRTSGGGSSTGLHPQTPVLDDQFYHGIGVRDHYYSYTKVYDNWIEKTEGPGIKIGSGDTHLIYENTIVGCGIGDDASYGHGIVTNSSGANADIYDNIIIEPVGCGFYNVNSPTGGVTLSRNMIGEFGDDEWDEQYVGDTTESTDADANWDETDVDSFGFDTWDDDSDYSNDIFSFSYRIFFDDDGQTIVDGDTACGGSACEGGDVLTLTNNISGGGTLTDWTTNDGLYLRDFEGTALAPIIIRNTSGSQTILDNEYDTSASAPYGDGIRIYDCQHVTIDGSNGYTTSSLDLDDPTAYTFGIRITRFKEKGIFLFGASEGIEIKYVQIDNIGDGGYGDAGIGIKENSKVGEVVVEDQVLDKLYVHHNYIYETTTEGMYLGGSGSCGSVSDANCCNSKDDTDDAVIWTDVQVYSNRTDNTGWDGISSSCCETASIHDNVITDAGLDDYTSGSGQGECLSLNRGYGGDAYNNRINGCQKQGILLDGTEATEIYNNIVSNVGKMATATIYEKCGFHDLANDGDAISLVHNTFVNVPTQAIRISTDQTGIGKNNLIVNEDTDEEGTPSSFGTTMTTADNVTKATVAECNFEDAGDDDYHLTSSTPETILASGTYDSEFATDFDGDTRANPPDVGFDEYSAGSSSGSVVNQTATATVNQTATAVVNQIE